MTQLYLTTKYPLARLLLLKLARTRCALQASTYITRCEGGTFRGDGKFSIGRRMYFDMQKDIVGLKRQ